MREDEERLHDQILPRLFMGGTSDDDWIDVTATPSRHASKERFDVVVTLFLYAQVADADVVELRYAFDDGPIEQVDLRRLVAAALFAHSHWTSGDRVLIRCQAGLNRSGLVTALVLMLHGMTPAAAIACIRSERSWIALCNSDFERWLLDEANELLTELGLLPLEDGA